MGNLGQKSLFNQKFLFSKKSLSFVLAILFALSIPLAAYGSWPSFQDDYTNNGVVGTQPPLSQPTAPATLTEVPLANSGAWIGVDAASVINSGVAYTLHNSGSGANVAATPLTGAAPTWDAVINPNAGSGDSQLSTPYYDTATNTLYAATTASSTCVTAAVPLSLSANATGSATANITLSQPVSTVLVQSDLNPVTSTDSGVYAVTLTNTSTSQTYPLVPAGTVFSGSYGTYYTYNDVQIPAGSYTITLTATAGSSGATAGTISLGRYDWTLYKLTNLTADAPTVTQLSTGEGQANTPIGYDSTYIYWGIWGGTRSYYQLNKSTNAVRIYTPTGDPNVPAYPYDNFYNAGAYSDGTYVIFGSDSGTIYTLYASTFTHRSAMYLNAGGYIGTAGQIRSTIVYSDGSVYFTAKGSGTNGYLVRAAVVSGVLTNPWAYRQLPGNSTSTPVVSANGYVYVGWNGYDAVSFTSEGGVVALPVGFTGNATPVDIYGNGADPNAGTPGDPVQSSPIVYSTAEAGALYDDIYFTTNAATGKGYGYEVEITPATPSTPIAINDVYELWYAGGTGAGGSNPYALQGFAADIYGDTTYLVYGDDSNTLYVMK